MSDLHLHNASARRRGVSTGELSSSQEVQAEKEAQPPSLGISGEPSVRTLERKNSLPSPSDADNGSPPLVWRKHNRDIVGALRKETRRANGYIDPDTALECFRLYVAWSNHPEDWIIDPDSGKLLQISKVEARQDLPLPSKRSSSEDANKALPPPTSRSVASIGLSGQLLAPASVTSADLDARNLIGLSQLFIENMRSANTDPHSGELRLLIDHSTMTVAMWNLQHMSLAQQQDAFVVRRLMVRNFQERLAASGVMSLFVDELAKLFIHNLGVQFNKPPPKVRIKNDPFLSRGTWNKPTSTHPPLKDDSWGGAGIGIHAKWIMVRLFNLDAYQYSFAKANLIPLEIAGTLRRIDAATRAMFELASPGNPNNVTEREALLRTLLAEAIIGLFERAPNPFPLALLDASLYAQLQQRLLSALRQLFNVERYPHVETFANEPLAYLQSIREIVDNAPPRPETGALPMLRAAPVVKPMPASQSPALVARSRALQSARSPSSHRTRFIGAQSEGSRRDISTRRQYKRWVNGFAKWIGMKELPSALQASIAAIFSDDKASEKHNVLQMQCIAVIMAYAGQFGPNLPQAQRLHLQSLVVKLLGGTYEPGLEKA